MKRDLKEFIHLYFGCDIQALYNGAEGLTHKVDAWIIHQVGAGQITGKLRLRPVDSMTQEEENEWRRMSSQFEGRRAQAEKFRWMLKKGLDIFNLIEDNLCTYE